mgnify:CR=1 FL=1
MEYKVINEISLTDLQKEINNHLTSGWTLQGGISVTRVENNGSTFIKKHYQALIK